MIYKHSIKSIIRTPKKTILFFFLLIVLTVFLNMGVGMYGSAQNMILDADKTFTTIVELEYLGDSSGDEFNFYNSMNLNLSDFQFNKLENHPNVKEVNMESALWASIDGYNNKQRDTPLYQYAMVRISNINKQEDNLYTGIVRDNLFGKRVREDVYMMISDVDESGNSLNFDFQKDHEYLIMGQIANEKTPALVMSPKVPDLVENTPYIIDLTENPGFFQSDEGQQILGLQKALEVIDNSLSVTTVTSLETTEPYYYNEIKIKEGRLFSEEEYLEKKDVIIISQAIADSFQVKLGDTLPLRMHYSKSGLGLSDYITDLKFDYKSKYEIVGILENIGDIKYAIYMPEPSWIQQDFHTKTLARFKVDNGTSENFIHDNQAALLANMEFTIYDQGYEEAVKPIIALKNNAVNILALGTLFGIAILFLFAYLYVVKQKDTLKTMLAIGSGKKKTSNYILFGSLTLVLISSLLGTIISYILLNKIMLILFERMKDGFEEDLRYSEKLIGFQMSYVPQLSMNVWLPILLGIFVILFSFIILHWFTYSVLKEDIQISARNKKKKIKSLIPRKTKFRRMNFEGLRPVSFKFALISLTRSPGRSFIVPIISFLLSILLIFLGLLSDIQKKELSVAYENIPVRAYITSSRNSVRDVAGLDLRYDIYRFIDPEYSYRVDWLTEMGNSLTGAGEEFTSFDAEEERENLLASSEFFKEMYLYTEARYEYMGVSKTKDGIEDGMLSNLPNIRKHDNSFGYDWFLNQVNKMPKLAYVDDLRYSPDFFNDSIPKVEFLEGYGYDSLGLRENIGVISRNFATINNIQNGDTIRITSWFDSSDLGVCSLIELKVVGIYNKTWETDTIYVPWIMSYDHNYYIDYNYPVTEKDGQKSEVFNELLSRNIRAVTFTLKNTNEINKFREYLEMKGYSQHGKRGDIRRVIIIQDKALIETVQSLENYIRLIDVIKPLMIGLFGIIGFVVSYLLIKHRISELAMMRSMGTRKSQVFFSFFIEQVILFLMGQVPIVLYMVLFTDEILLYSLSLVYVFVLYLFGTTTALLIMNRAKILDILFAED